MIVYYILFLESTRLGVIHSRASSDAALPQEENAAYAKPNRVKRATPEFNLNTRYDKRRR
jgi:hypothetical protein